MSDNLPDKNPPSPTPPDPAPAPASIAPATPHVPTEQRRDFFGEAVREMILPFTGIIERKINPFLAALEQLPNEAQRLADMNFGVLDQPAAPRSLPVHPTREITRYLRPPGAMAPGEFESVCSRCAKCVEVCPADAIQLDPHGLTADGFPYIVADTQPCVVCESLACMKSCPTGALKLVDRLQIKMGTASVDHHQCLRGHGEGCTLCIDVCPIDGKPLDPDGQPTSPAALFISPESGQIRVRKNVCIGCGLCENRCPTEPRAITITPYAPPIDPIIA